MAQSIANMPIPLPQAFVFLLEKMQMSHGRADSSLKTPWWGIKKCANAPPQDSIKIALDYEWSPFFLRESRASKTQARVKITSLEKGETQRGERKMGDYKQGPGLWTYALLSQRKTLIGFSIEICQHLSKTRQPLSTLDIITISRTNNQSCSCKSN